LETDHQHARCISSTSHAEQLRRGGKDIFTANGSHGIGVRMAYGSERTVVSIPKPNTGGAIRKERE